jgi:hypothetical protein
MDPLTIGARMQWFGRGIICLASLSVSLLAFAQASGGEQGWLAMEQHVAFVESRGAAEASLFVYHADGTPVVAPTSNGGFPAGTPAALEPGTYFVEVGRFRTGGSVARAMVEAGALTVVPTGWVSVQTPPVDEQPALGCSPWQAELSAFDHVGGREVVKHSNHDAGLGGAGALQLLSGPARLYFNGLPVSVEVPESGVLALPVGFQDPVAGERPILAAARGEDPTAIRVSLCEDGALQVPAGTYQASGIVPIDVHPYEARQWVSVEVPRSEGGEVDDLRAARWPDEVRDRPVATTPVVRLADDDPALEPLRTPGATTPRRLQGFGR